MRDLLTEEQLKEIRRLSGGSISSSRRIRQAAQRIMLDYADEEDYEIIFEYLED